MSYELVRTREAEGLAAGIRRLTELVARTDGMEAFAEQTLLNLAVPGSSEYFLAVDTPAGAGTPAVVGAAIVDLRNESVELAVAPGERRSGIGRRLLEMVGQEFPTYHVWAHGTLPAARGLATAEGMQAERTLLVMRRSLAAGADQDAAARLSGFRVAPIDVERDLAALTELNAAAFANHPEQGKLTEEDMRQRCVQDWFDPSLLLLVYPGAEEPKNGAGESKPVAFLWLKPHSDEAIELYVLGVHPAAQGRGIGGALSAHTIAIMRARGFTEAILYVDEANEPAVRSYRRVGFEISEKHASFAFTKR